MACTIAQIRPEDQRMLAQIDALLEQEGIHRDTHLDYICAMFDESFTVVATGSCFGNTLRCFAVSREHQGEGLLNQIVTHLISIQLERGNTRLFLYTKISTARFFSGLGFHEIAQVDGTLVFMENRKNGFASYLKTLVRHRRGPSAAIVMNANPFTLGHQYLVELAAAQWDRVHLFVISEDTSLVPFDVRRRLILAGIAHLPNVCLHNTGPYIISNSTFPSYFLKEEDAVIQGHALLDLAVFARIACALDITCRYVGDEPTSRVTGLYNEVMKLELPKVGIQCRVIPRLEIEEQPISASTVRRALQDGNWDKLRRLVPPTTYGYFTSLEAVPVIERIRQASDVAHY